MSVEEKTPPQLVPLYVSPKLSLCEGGCGTETKVVHYGLPRGAVTWQKSARCSSCINKHVYRPTYTVEKYECCTKCGMHSIFLSTPNPRRQGHTGHPGHRFSEAFYCSCHKDKFGKSIKHVVDNGATCMVDNQISFNASTGDLYNFCSRGDV